MARRERPLEPANDDAITGFATDLRELRRTAGNPPYRALAARAHYSAASLSDAASGRKLPSLAVTLAYVGACGGDVTEWEKRWRAITEEDEAAPADDEGAPYTGLAAFQVKDTERFFGRDELVTDLLARLAERRVIAVVGASGAGKSSLLRAGLLARLRAGEVDRPAVLFAPGSHPVEECAIQLAQLTGGSPAQVRAELDADARGLHRIVRQLAPESSELVIVVDQFEELFTLCHDRRERERFIHLLLTAAQADNSRCRVVLGVRADFYAQVTTHAELTEALRDGHVVVGPMTTDQLRQAITDPAASAGLTVETALVTRLVGDTTGQPGVLPLLSHALLETWRRRRGSILTLEGYERAGGLGRAVANTAEGLYTSLTEPQRLRARQLFLRLTALGDGTEDTKRRIRRDELDVDDPDTDVVLEQLTQARLLTVDSGGIELSHEALIRSWPRLTEWLTADRDGFRTHRQLTEAAEVWDTLDEDPGALYRGARLTITREWAGRDGAALSARERRFLDASVAAETREQTATRRRARRMRQLVALLSVLLVIAAATSFVAINAEREAADQRDIALSQKVAAEANGLRGGNPALAAQLALAAYRLAPTVEARGALLSASTAPATTTYADDITSMAFSRDGRFVAAGGSDDTVRIWSRRTPHRPVLLATLPPMPDDVMSVLVSPDGATLTVGGIDGTVRTWDLADPANPKRLAEFDAGAGQLVYGYALSPDGSTVATADENGSVELWRITDPLRPKQVGTFVAHPQEVNAVAFNPQGTMLVTAGEDGTAALWSLTDHTRLGVLAGHDGFVLSVAFNPAGTMVATASADHRALVWDVRDPRAPVVLSELPGHINYLSSVAFSPSGTEVATASWDHTARLWDLSDPKRPALRQVLTNHTNEVWFVVFTPDGRGLATASTDHTAVVTDIPGPVLAGNAQALATASYRPDGRLVATGSEDNTARLWDMANPDHPRPLAVLDGLTGPVKAAVFSPNGQVLALGSIDTTIALWDVRDPRHPVRLPVLTGHTDGVRSLVFTPDGKLLVSAGVGDAVVRFWDVADPKHPRSAGRLPGQRAGTMSVALARDGHTLATTMSDKVTLWDITDPARPERLAELSGHTDRVDGVAFSPDGHTLATGSLDRTVRLWDVTDPRRGRQLATLTGHSDGVVSVAFRPDGRMLATASFDDTARLWDVTDRTAPSALATLTGHTDRVYSVDFAPDGTRLVTTSLDRTARVWMVDSERVAARICASAYPRITDAEWDEHFTGLGFQAPCPA
jgi:WD40 repeat protein